MDTAYIKFSYLSAFTEFFADRIITIVYSSGVHATRRLFRGLYTLTCGIDSIENVLGHVHIAANKLITSSFSNVITDFVLVEEYLNSKQEHYEKLHKQDKKAFTDWPFSISNRQTIRSIMGFIQEHTLSVKFIPITNKYASLAYYIAEQDYARQHDWKLPVQETSTLFQKIPEMCEFIKFAIAIYKINPREELIKVNLTEEPLQSSSNNGFIASTGIKKEDILCLSPISLNYLPAYAVILVNQFKTIVVVVRGTACVFDILSDLESRYTDYTCGGITGQLHSGIYKSSEKLSELLKPMVLRQLQEHPGYSLTLMGHSLGAGCAAILTLMWKNDPNFSKIEIKTYAYAPPAVVSENLSEVLKGIVLSCVHGCDVIPRICFGTMKDLCNCIECFYESDTSKENHHGIYRDAIDRCNNIKLVVPGDILQVYEKQLHSDARLCVGPFDDDAVCANFVNHEFYWRIVFSQTMLHDHHPPSYQKCLQALAKVIKSRAS